MFCHDAWQEKLSYNSVDQAKMFDFNLTKEEREAPKVTEFDWYMPCKYEYDRDGEKKDMFLYYMLYNATLTEQNTLTNWANS